MISQMCLKPVKVGLGSDWPVHMVVVPLEIRREVKDAFIKRELVRIAICIGLEKNMSCKTTIIYNVS